MDKMKLRPTFFLLILLIPSTLLNANNKTLNTDSIRAINTYKTASYLIRENNYTEAIDSLKISSALWEKIYSKDSYEYAITQNVLGISYRNLGNFDKAIEHFLLAEQSHLAVSSPNKMAIARLYNNIGNVYKDKLNYGTALEYFQRAISIYSTVKEDLVSDIADVQYNIAENYYKQDKYYKVLEIIEQYYDHAYSDTKLFFLSLKAASLKELELNDEAYKSYIEVIEYAIDFYSETDINVAFEYLSFANFLISTYNYDEAMEVLNNAKSIFDKNKIREGTTLALYYKALGGLLENLKVETKGIDSFREQKSANLHKAMECYKKGLKALRMDISNLSDISVSIENTLSLTESLRLLKLVADTYTQIAEIYDEQKNSQRIESLSQALDYYAITSNMIQQARKEIYSDENKIQLSELEEATFSKIVQTAYKAYEAETNPKIAEFAFTNAERMKASSVFDRLSDQLAKENSLVPDSLTELERTLNYRITSQNEKLFDLRQAEESDNTEIAIADSVLFQLKKQRDELTQYLEKNYSDYYDLKYSDATISTSEIQKNLDSDEMLFEYVLNETDSIPELYVFCFSKDYTEFRKLNIDSDFIHAVEEAFRFMSNSGYLFTRSDNAKAFCVASHQLYQKLFLPFESQIQNKKITVIPDGKLSYLPFDALLTEMPDTTGQVQFNRLPYMILNNSIHYAYSANLLFKFNRQQRKAKNRLLAFAPEYRSDTLIFENEKLVLVPLPGIQREVDLISKEIKTRLFRGENATEIQFREESKQHDILHLAMHAFINDSLPAFSRFAFTQNQNSEPENDGWLNTADIYNLDLNARLTVLSACNTGSGNLRKGEGIMSLARGFLYAGCPSIVMTLWEVEDNAGTKIMSSFYRNLKKGRATDEALRLAKLKYLENANPRMAHPHYWLGYVSIGNTQPLFRSYDFYFFGLLILVLTGIITDQLIIRIKKARKKRHKN
ncbi:CHAT domain-containing protein [Mariniphaga sediminis]|uniref:CHAT domain-containing protein n=2 Tax=Mariniphaga sediminis TaxID=1628158 RepID=A0A399CX00_9BACT|nr:CHAT domain-containing protein [Mariniphaga sediminis]